MKNWSKLEWDVSSGITPPSIYPGPNLFIGWLVASWQASPRSELVALFQLWLFNRKITLRVQHTRTPSISSASTQSVMMWFSHMYVSSPASWMCCSAGWAVGKTVASLLATSQILPQPDSKAFRLSILVTVHVAVVELWHLIESLLVLLSLCSCCWDSVVAS